MAKDQKPREPTWKERAATLTYTTNYPEHEGTEPRPVVGKRCWFEQTTKVLVVYDMRTKVWASDAEKALYEAAGSQAHGAARPARIASAVSMSIEFVVRELDPRGATHYRIPPLSKLRWYRGDKAPAAPKSEAPEKTRVNLSGCVPMKVGNRFVARCSACWARGHYEHAASTHNSMQEAAAAAAAHRCKT